MTAPASIQYRDLRKWPYVVTADFNQQLPQDLIPFANIAEQYVSLSASGVLCLKRGYAWNGATCAIDTPAFMTPSGVHDALYQLMYQKHLALSSRVYVDRLLRDMCLDHGMSWFRAQYVYAAVRMAGGAFIRP